MVTVMIDLLARNEKRRAFIITVELGEEQQGVKKRRLKSFGTETLIPISS
ncbi:MAG: hypothetical protein ETSY2_31915 [Candidatus Entotheonella gemina]|uniref:Uncharacterized protein n=1 Tax=Candidatus Entotheonella gemina TaxID=1429439 RepID=W4M0P9_9BACT|nr:MAG: hypothetical protein ETSY2_31915 [Candidatus Entotheonella gemina]